MNNNFSTILGHNLLTITDVYKGTGISRSTLGNLYYQRINSIKIKTLIKICDYLQIPLSELIEYIPDKNK